MKKEIYYLCPVEGFVPKTESHAFIYDCTLENDTIGVRVTNKCYLTDKPIFMDISLGIYGAFQLVVDGAKIGYEINGIDNFEDFKIEFNALNPNLIETLIFLNDRLN